MVMSVVTAPVGPVGDVLGVEVFQSAQIPRIPGNLGCEKNLDRSFFANAAVSR